MNTYTFFACLVVLSAIAYPGSLCAAQSAQELSTEEIAFVDSLFNEWDSAGSPGAAVGIMRGGRLVFEKGYGQAELEHGAPIGPATVFHVASDSKRFTALAILELEAAGTLHRDDDIRHYLPEVSGLEDEITIRDLLNHTSGLRDQWQLLGLSGARDADAVTTAQVLGLVGRQRAVNFRPGEQFMYCNTGYTLLAEIVSRVAGEPFADFMDRTVFAPLGMTSTRFVDDYQTIVPGRASSYTFDAGTFVFEPMNYAVPGATNLSTTVQDLARWIAHANKRFHLSRPGDPYRELLTADTTALGDAISHGYGVAASDYRGTTLLGHGGNDAGFASYFARLPELDAGVIVLANTPGVQPASKAFQIIDRIFTHHLVTPADEEPDPPPDPTHDPDRFDRYLGAYQFEDGGRLNVVKEFWWLAVGAPGAARYQRLTPVKDQPYVFVEPTSGERYRFTVPETGASVRSDAVHRLLDSGVERKARRVVASSESIEGTYYSPELETRWSLRVTDDGRIQMTHLRGQALAFFMVADDHFEGGTWFANKLVFVRDPGGTACGMLVSARRITNVWFARMKPNADTEC